MKKPECCLIGCGRIAFLLENDKLRKKPCTHFGGAASAGLEITGASDISEERLGSFIKASGIDRESCYTDYRNLLRERKPEIAIISTWTESHAEIAVDAIKNGAEIVILEKPVSYSLRESIKIIRTAERYGAVVIVNHERRFDNRYRKVKSLIESGEIGRIISANARIHTGRYRGNSRVTEGGGPLLHDGTHLVDIIRFFFGEIESVTGDFQRIDRQRGFEDCATAWLRTVSGTDIFLEAGGGRKYFLFEIEIWGSDGKIIIGNGCNRLYKYKKSSMYTGFNDLCETTFPPVKPNNCFEELYSTVMKIYNGKKSSCDSTLIDGHKALETIHGVYYSSFSGNKQVRFPLKPGSINLEKIFTLN